MINQSEKHEVSAWQEALKELKKEEKKLMDEIRQRVKAERENPCYSDGRPKPLRHWFNMHHQFILQRGGTINYQSVNGEHVEWSLKGWRIINYPGCAFASKSEPKRAYICIPNCPGYGGQVA
jgi:hypothetical protein